MTDDTWIEEVVVDGLHDQFDIELKLKPGLNILYGKNGRGKTTMLHLIANALELDFKRFAYLQFRRIRIKTSKGDLLDITREAEGGAIRVICGDLLVYLANHFLHCRMLL